jgi:hypothetical protein
MFRARSLPVRGKLRLSRLLEEPDCSSPEHYARRVRWLSLVHPLLFLVCAAGDVLLIWRGEFFITLAQRSNVEALTIAFCIAIFAYFAFLTLPGCWGALRLLGFRLLPLTSREPAKMRALGAPGDGHAVALDSVVTLEGQPGSWELAVRDEFGSLGRLCFDGVTIRHRDALRGGSNTLFGFLQTRLSDLTGADLEIVEWESTSGDDYNRYRATTHALEAIGAKLEIAALPRVVLTAAHKAQLEHELARLCPALRAEAFLPDWEFSGEHKLPIIPEPLGFISLSRTESRVDPLATLVAALVTMTLLVAVTCFFLARPPWLPGR